MIRSLFSRIIVRGVIAHSRQQRQTTTAAALTALVSQLIDHSNSSSYDFSSARRSFSSTTKTKDNNDDDDVVGFIGLGNMGLPMATNLLKDEYRVVAYDQNPIACEQGDKAGMEIVSSAGEIATSDQIQTIFTMLPTCDAVDDTMNELAESIPDLSRSDVAANNHRPHVIVDCSTVSPTISRKWHSELGKRGHVMLDAPVSGGVKGATDATLTFMIGYHFDHGYEIAAEYMECMGTKLIVCGGPGTGSATKLCNNLALATQMIGICEAMNLGEALGVDPVTLADVMNQSTAKCWSCDVNNPHPKVAWAKSTPHHEGPPASRDYDGGFATKLMLKDLGLAVAAASDTNVTVPLTANSMQLYRLADAHGLGEKDFGILLQLLKGSKAWPSSTSS